MPKKTPKPAPVPQFIVCSLCGEPWTNHKQDENGEVTTLECIRLLKAQRYTTTITIQPQPWVYPQPRPYQPFYPVWYGTQTTGITTTNAVSYTPKVVNAVAC